jgi:histone methylation protein DOT1
MFRVIMTNSLLLTIFFFLILIVILTALWMVVPAFFGPPSVGTRPHRIRKALQLVNLQPDEIFYDLGAGDGRVLLIAAGEFGAQAVGLEIGPVQYLWIWLRVMTSGLRNKIKIQWTNYLKADLTQADVVFVYATSKEVAKLVAHLPSHMQRGSKLVSISADFPEWEPQEFDPHELIFVYQMPPTLGSLTTFQLKHIK